MVVDDRGGGGAFRGRDFESSIADKNQDRHGKTAPSRHTGTLSHITASRRDELSCQQAVSQWTEEVTSPLPHLSKPQAAVLALWSLGMVLARSCALSAVSTFLAVGLDRKVNTVRHQVREFC